MSRERLARVLAECTNDSVDWSEYNQSAKDSFLREVDAVLKELVEILREPPKDNRLITSAKQRAFAAMIKQMMEGE